MTSADQIAARLLEDDEPEDPKEFIARHDAELNRWYSILVRFGYESRQGANNPTPHEDFFAYDPAMAKRFALDATRQIDVYAYRCSETKIQWDMRLHVKSRVYDGVSYMYGLRNITRDIALTKKMAMQIERAISKVVEQLNDDDGHSAIARKFHSVGR